MIYIDTIYIDHIYIDTIAADTRQTDFESEVTHLLFKDKSDMKVIIFLTTEVLKH